MGREAFSLSDRVAVVTGASRNIGAALSRAFAEAGADLLMVARTAGPLQAVASGISADTGRRVETLVLDVAEPGAALAVADHAQRCLPAIDILVNNAYSVGAVAPVLETPDDAWERAFAVNVMAPMHLCQALAPSMRQRHGGSIINVLSGSGFLPTPSLGCYGASKAALWMLTRSLAVELAPDIRVNAICPGVVSEDGRPRSDAQRSLLPDVPMRRVARPQEIVGAAIYLASSMASYTTGEVIFANGGRPW